MESLWKLALAAALVSLVLGILAHYGVMAIWVIASPSGFLRFTDTCLLFGILFLVAGRLSAPKPPA